MKTKTNRKMTAKEVTVNMVMALPAFAAIAFTILDKHRMLFTAITGFAGMVGIPNR